MEENIKKKYGVHLSNVATRFPCWQSQEFGRLVWS